ncbi:MAG: winged helix-turn-helix transcriptional regulator [Candidatus Izemoplasmatales bacterium]|jgi:sugar/nucleoside kinase (ribokinase family)/DNA-binding CsgD family transcriptional regulator|nr:winged helix-turn-helix transcriptional regulator [Candidatus Izemoplasmatales bacterium]
MKLNDNEIKVLAILEEDPYINQKNIADKMNLSRPAVANLISGLQTKGYIIGKPYVLRKKEYVTCVGGANVDYTFNLEDQMIMGTSNPVSKSISYGGVIRNIAENLARLNQRVSLMSLVGKDTVGENLLKDNKKLMEVFATDTLDNQPTGSYYSVIDKHGNMSVGFADMSINDLMDRTWILEHRKHLILSSWIIADTNIKKSGLEALVEYANNEDKNLCIVGVSGPKMRNMPDDISGVNLIITNLDESQTYFNSSTDDLFSLAKLWLDKGVERIVITEGKKGFVYGNKSFLKHQEAFIVEEKDIVDVTGAGDAFSAATIYGIINNLKFEEAVKLGAISSSLTIKQNHAVNPNLSINLLKKELKKQ